jgi:hypothetical protein
MPWPPFESSSTRPLSYGRVAKSSEAPVVREHACTLSSYVLYVHDPDQARLAFSELDSGELGKSGLSEYHRHLFRRLRPQKYSFGID